MSVFIVRMRSCRFELEVGCPSLVGLECAEGMEGYVAVSEGTMAETVGYPVPCGSSVDVVLTTSYVWIVRSCGD